jgi:hypothetical protein
MPTPFAAPGSDGQTPILMFCHIPKTAGTSMNWLLRRYFGRELLAAQARSGAPDGAYRALDLVRDLSLLPHSRCLSGHCLKPYVDFGEDERRLRWFTFLRKPEDRFLSLYLHQQVRSDPMYRMDLRDWARKFRRSNGMVRMLAGEESLDKAKEVLLCKFAFVGFVESFDASLHACAEAFGLDGFNRALGSRRMVSKGREILERIRADPASYSDCIAGNNALDRRLYDFAQSQRIGWPDAPPPAPEQPGQGKVSMAWRYGQFWLQDRLRYRRHLRDERRSFNRA